MDDHRHYQQRQCFTPNVLFNIPDRIATDILIEDDNYIYKPVLEVMNGVSEELEFYKYSNHYISADNIVNALEERLKKGDSFVIRTDYHLSEDEIVKLLREAVKNTKVTNISGVNYWLGVISVNLE